LSQDYVNRRKKQIRAARKKLKPKYSVEQSATGSKVFQSSSGGESIDSASSFLSEVESLTSVSETSSVIEETTDEKSLSKIVAMKKRLRRAQASTNGSLQTKNAKLMSQEERLAEEMQQQERFSYNHKKYIDRVGVNPVVVTASKNVKILDKMPKVNILEDCQFRKALPKTFKVYESVAPFSQRLGRIKDSNKFMNALSLDMLRSVVLREQKYYNDRHLEDLNMRVDAKHEHSKMSRSQQLIGGLKEEAATDEEQKKERDKQLAFLLEQKNYVYKKPFTENLLESQSLKDRGMSLQGKARQRVFGADDLKFPEGMTIMKALDWMSEKELLELNEMLCKKYETELFWGRMKKDPV